MYPNYPPGAPGSSSNKPSQYQVHGQNAISHNSVGYPVVQQQPINNPHPSFRYERNYQHNNLPQSSSHIREYPPESVPVHHVTHSIVQYTTHSVSYPHHDQNPPVIRSHSSTAYHGREENYQSTSYHNERVEPHHTSINEPINTPYSNERGQSRSHSSSYYTSRRELSREKSPTRVHSRNDDRREGSSGYRSSRRERSERYDTTYNYSYSRSTSPSRRSRSATTQRLQVLDKSRSPSIEIYSESRQRSCKERPRSPSNSRFNRRSRSKSLDNKRKSRSPSGAKEYSRKRRRSRSNDAPEKINREVDEGQNLPNHLNQSKSRIIYLNRKENYGILSLIEGSEKIMCGFFIEDVFNGNEDDRFKVNIGDIMMTNAKLISRKSKIPYLASTVWNVNAVIPQGVAIKLLQDLDSKSMERYNQVLKNFNSDILKDPVKTISEVTLSDDDDPEALSSRSDSIECVFDGTKKKKKKKKRKKGRRRVSGDADDVIEVEPTIDVSSSNNVFACSGIVKSYIAHHFGVIQFERHKQQLEAFFHFNQLWHKNAVGEPQLSRETESVFRMKDILAEGSPVSCLIRKLQDPVVEYQIISITSTDNPKPDIRLNTKLIEDLDYHLSVLKYFLENKDESHLKVDPFPHKVKIAEGIIIEYVSNEMGLIRLIDDASEDSKHQTTAIFHFDDTWADGVLLKDCQHQTLTNFLPIGQKVNFFYRKLPSSRYSEIKFQAMAVWSEKSSETQFIFNERHKDLTDRIKLYNNLEEKFDSFKQISGLSLSGSTETFPFVHLLINGLPEGCSAFLSKQINQEFAIIQVAIEDRGEEKSVEVLIHKSDIYDSKGKQICTKENELKDFLSLKLNLRARTISKADNPDALMALIGKNAGVELPLLQAVYAQVVENENQSFSSLLPQPVMMKKYPASFGTKKRSFYFANYMQKFDLDKKLQSFIESTGAQQYFRRFVNPDWQRLDLEVTEMKLLKELELIDTNCYDKIAFGDICNVKDKCFWDSQSLPNKLSDCYCKPVFLWKQYFHAFGGVVEFFLPRTTTKCFAFVDVSSIQLFDSGSVDYLESYMPVDTSDSYRACFKLADRDKFVPYIGTCIWNESERLSKKMPIPFEESSSIDNSRMLAFLDSYSQIFSKPLKCGASKSCQTQMMSSAVDSVASAEDDLIDLDEDGQSRASNVGTTVVEELDLPEDQILLIPIPPGVETCANVKQVKKESLLYVDEELVTSIENGIGSVESILSSKHFVIQYQHSHEGKSHGIRILCNKTCSDSGSSDDKIYQGCRVIFNATILLSDTESGIGYLCSSYSTDTHSLLSEGCLKSGKDFSGHMKISYENITKFLDNELKVKSGLPLEMLVDDDDETPSKDLKIPSCGEFKLFFLSVAETESLPTTSRSEPEKSLDKRMREKLSSLKKEKIDAVEGKITPFENLIGQVIKIIDGNYGLALIREDKSNSNPKIAELIFDKHDIEESVKDAGQWNLSDKVEIGMFLKTNTVLFEEVSKCHMATGAVVADNIEELMEKKLTSGKKVKSNEIDHEKFSNFKSVVNAVKKEGLTEQERKIVSSAVKRLSKLGKEAASDNSLLKVKTNTNPTADSNGGEPTEDKEMKTPEVKSLLKGKNTNQKTDSNTFEPTEDKEVKTPEAKSSLKEKNINQRTDSNTFEPTEDKEVKTPEAKSSLKEKNTNQKTDSNTFEPTKDKEVKTPELKEKANTNQKADSNNFQPTEDKEVKTPEAKSSLREHLPNICPPKASNMDVDFKDVPSSVSDMTGVVIQTCDEFTLIKFKITSGSTYDCFAYLMETQKFNKQEVFRTGFPVKFHALHVEKDCFLVFSAYQKANPSARRKFLSLVKKDDWISSHEQTSQFQSSKQYVEQHHDKISIFAKTFPCVLLNVSGKIVKVLKISEESQIVLIRINDSRVTSFGMYLDETECKLGDEVIVEAFLIEVLTITKYLVISVCQEKDKELDDSLDYSSLRKNKVEIFQKNLAHVEEIAYILSLMEVIEDASIQRLFSILKKLSFSQTKSILNSFSGQLSDKITVEDFNESVDVLTSFSLAKVKKECAVNLSEIEIAQFLVLVSKGIFEQTVPECLKTLDFFLMRKLKDEGLCLMISKIPKLLNTNWKIPKEFLSQSRYMAMENIVCPPNHPNWSTENDERLLFIAFEKEVLFKSDFGANLKRFFEADLTEHFLEDRARFLLELVLTRGRHFTERNIDVLELVKILIEDKKLVAEEPALSKIKLEPQQETSSEEDSESDQETDDDDHDEDMITIKEEALD